MFSLGVSTTSWWLTASRTPSSAPRSVCTAQRMVSSSRAGSPTGTAPLGHGHRSLRSILRQVLASLDYTNLDEHAAFPGRSSTTERLAEFLAHSIAKEVAKVPADAAPAGPRDALGLLRESPVGLGELRACHRGRKLRMSFGTATYRLDRVRRARTGERGLHL